MTAALGAGATVALEGRSLRWASAGATFALEGRSVGWPRIGAHR